MIISEVLDFIRSFNGAQEFPSDTVLGVLIGVTGGEIKLIEMGDYQFRLDGDDLTLGTDNNPDEYWIPYIGDTTI